MSNTYQSMIGLGITAPVSTAGIGTQIGDVVMHEVDMDTPDGKQWTAKLRIGVDGPGDAEARRSDVLSNTYAPALTERLEDELTKLQEHFNDITGYDRDGQPLLRVTGRDRELLELKIANRRNALALAWKTRREVEAFQLAKRNEATAADARITAAAEVRARELAEEAEIERRAKLIASRIANAR